MTDAAHESANDGAAHATAILVENHRAFLRYLERRLGSREAAEDVLQEAFVRHLARADAVPDEALVPWFYRVLRNALIDRVRRGGAAARALAAFARELEIEPHSPGDLDREICACVGRLAATLKPEYRDALQAVEIDGLPVKAYAERSGLTAANAGVRVFRARQALRRRVTQSCGTCAEHGCSDCSCRQAR